MGKKLHIFKFLLCALFQAAICIKLDLFDPSKGYHAVVKENEREVDISPKIRAIEGEVCEFIISNKHHGEVPFVVEIEDKSKGEGKIISKKELNCEKRKSYRFDIAAVSCEGEKSDNVAVHLRVNDVNEYSPVFESTVYNVNADEGKLYDHIIQVRAEDSDCSSDYGDICKYEILNPDEMFDVDQDGRIRNTKPLIWEKSHNHILSVVAYDCAMKRSKPATVNIKVNRVCHTGWKGIHERIEYTPGAGSQVLFPSAQMEMCDFPCEAEKFNSRITLATQHIGKGCDRDTYAVESQRKLCGASLDSVDLLPTPGLGGDWTRNLPTDEGHESDQIYEFDGSTTAVVVPEEHLNHNLTHKFTVAFWLKHEPLPDKNHSHTKEHIICNADDHKHSRHHYAMFIRNCRLILLLRREFDEEKPNVFGPAEWRWKLPEVCDNQWHHYAVSIDVPEAVLYIDGQPFKIQHNNPEIVDDWPLHAAKGVNTTMVVGACWQGRENLMSFHLRGFMAGLSILRGRTENPQVLSCLHKCKESLDVPPVELLEPGVELLTNSDASEVTINGASKQSLEELISRVGYLNSREFPTPGRRNLRISTSAVCSNGKIMKLPTASAYILVLQPEQPSININGTTNLAREYEAFKQGIQLFSTVSIWITQDKDEEIEMHTTEGSHLLSEYKLDSCVVQVYPPLNPDHEYFRLPNNLMQHLVIHSKENKDGLIIHGADLIHNYELVLREILYFNRKPAYYLNRAFKLVCSELNGRFISNEYIQTLTVIHPHAEPAHEKSEQSVLAAHAQISDHKVELKDAEIKSSNYKGSAENIGKASANHAVTIIIVVCVGFLVFMIVLGVIRIRAAHRRAQETRDEDQEMAWDDSSLTITVNPMDKIEQVHGIHQANEEDEDSDSSEDGSSYHDESSEEEPEKAKARELEWDDSTLTF